MSARGAARSILALLLPLLLLAAEAAALPIRPKPRRTRSTFGARTGTGARVRTNVRPGANQVTSRSGATRPGGGGQLRRDVTPVERSNATHGREQATHHQAEGGDRGVSGADPQVVRQGLFGVPGPGGTTGLRNGLDGSQNVVTTRRITPPDILVVRNQPGAHLSRGGALMQAKRVARLPRNARPRRVYKERLRESDQPHGAGAPIRHSRVYEFDGPDGTTIKIREHSYGHVQDMAGPHFNLDYYKGGTKVTDSYLPQGADRHFYFVR